MLYLRHQIGADIPRRSARLQVMMMMLGGDGGDRQGDDGGDRLLCRPSGPTKAPESLKCCRRSRTQTPGSTVKLASRGGSGENRC